MNQYKASRLRQIRSQISDIEWVMDRNYEMVNSFTNMTERAHNMLRSAKKMKEQYMGQHRHASLELDNLFIEIEELNRKERKYTKKEVDEIILRRDGKLNQMIYIENRGR